MGKSAQKKSEIPLDALPPELANLRALAGDEMMRQAMELARERLGLTVEKLALLIVRIVNPDELIKQGEEAQIRGVGDPKTLKGYKDEGLLSHFLGSPHRLPILDGRQSR